MTLWRNSMSRGVARSVMLEKQCAESSCDKGIVSCRIVVTSVSRLCHFAWRLPADSSLFHWSDWKIRIVSCGAVCDNGSGFVTRLLEKLLWSQICLDSIPDSFSSLDFTNQRGASSLAETRAKSSVTTIDVRYDSSPVPNQSLLNLVAIRCRNRSLQWLGIQVGWVPNQEHRTTPWYEMVTLHVWKSGCPPPALNDSAGQPNNRICMAVGAECLALSCLETAGLATASFPWGGILSSILTVEFALRWNDI